MRPRYRNALVVIALFALGLVLFRRRETYGNEESGGFDITAFIQQLFGGFGRDAESNEVTVAEEASRQRLIEAPNAQYVQIIMDIAYDASRTTTSEGGTGNDDDTHAIINVSELEVYDDQGVLISKGKPVEADNFHPAGPLANLTDGHKWNFAHTLGRDENEIDDMIVDLGSMQKIGKVRLTNRRSCCAHRTAGIKFVLLDSNRNKVGESPTVKGWSDVVTYNFRDAGKNVKHCQLRTITGHSGTLGACEKPGDYVPKAAQYHGSWFSPKDPVRHEENIFKMNSTDTTDTYVVAHQSPDDWCKMVQFDITKEGGDCKYKLTDVGYSTSPTAASTCETIDEVRSHWENKNNTTIANNNSEGGYGIETLWYGSPCTGEDQEYRYDFYIAVQNNTLGLHLGDVLADGERVPRSQMQVHAAPNRYPCSSNESLSSCAEPEYLDDAGDATWSAWNADGHSVGTKVFTVYSHKKVKKFTMAYQRPIYAPGWMIKENGVTKLTETTNRGDATEPSPVSYDYPL